MIVSLESIKYIDGEAKIMVDVKLNTLLMVEKYKSFTRAAQQLSLTQPAVSQHIKQLENELHIKIFNKAGNQIKATAEGEILIQYAKRNLALYDNLLQNIQNEKRNITKLIVGITHTSESNPVAEALGRYCSKNEGKSITIYSDSINNLYDMLTNYEIDLAITEGNLQQAGINSLLLDTDSLVLAVSNDSPLAKRSMVTINELKQEKLILRSAHSGTRNLFVSHLESHNISLSQFHVIMEIDNIATIKDLIRRDIGVSVLAKSVCWDELKKGKITVLPIENLSMIREVNILYHDDFPHIEVLQSIMREYNQVKDREL